MNKNLYNHVQIKIQTVWLRYQAAGKEPNHQDGNE